MHQPGLPQQTVSLMYRGYNKQTKFLASSPVLKGNKAEHTTALSGLQLTRLQLTSQQGFPNPGEDWRRVGFCTCTYKRCIWQAVAMPKGDQQSRKLFYTENTQRFFQWEPTSNPNMVLPLWQERVPDEIFAERFQPVWESFVVTSTASG